MLLYGRLLQPSLLVANQSITIAFHLSLPTGNPIFIGRRDGGKCENFDCYDERNTCSRMRYRSPDLLILLVGPTFKKSFGRHTSLAVVLWDLYALSIHETHFLSYTDQEACRIPSGKFISQSKNVTNY